MMLRRYRMLKRHRMDVMGKDRNDKKDRMDR